MISNDFERIILINMSEFEPGFVPLDEAISERARFAVTLPEFVNTDNIGVNLRGLERLANMGGIAHVRVDTVEGDVSQFVPIIVGVNKDGTAIAGKAGVKTSVPTYTLDLEHLGSLSGWTPKFLPHATDWINTRVTVNTNEVKNRIKDDSKWKNGVHSTEAWAYHLNKSVKEGVTDQGIKHLTLELSKFSWGEAAIQYGLLGFFETQSTNPTWENLIFKYSILWSIMNFWSIRRAERNGENYRLSAFIGPQLDRALILKLMSTRTTLVKDFSSKPTQNH